MLELRELRELRLRVSTPSGIHILLILLGNVLPFDISRHAMPCPALPCHAMPLPGRTEYRVQRTAYSVQRTEYGVQRSAYSVQCTAYSVQRIAYNVQRHCTPFSPEYSTLYSFVPACHSSLVTHPHVRYANYTYTDTSTGKEEIK